MKNATENDFDVMQEKHSRKKKFEKKFTKETDYMREKKIKNPRKKMYEEEEEDFDPKKYIGNIEYNDDEDYDDEY